MRSVWIQPEENDIKYLDDLSNEFRDYIAKLVIEVFHGVSRNIGVSDPDSLASKPPTMLHKGFLSGLIGISKRVINFVGRRRPWELFRVKGLKLYRRGKPMTQAEWDDFNIQVTNYMRPYLNDIAEEMAIKGVLLGMAAGEAEAQNKTIRQYGKNSLEQMENEYFYGYIPDSLRSAQERYIINDDVQRAINLAFDRSAQYVQTTNEKLRKAIQEQVVAAYRKSELDEGYTARQLASDLYWMKDENPELKNITAESILRDWQRVAVTELAYIHAAGKIAPFEHQARQSMTGKEPPVYLMFVKGTCPWCQAHHGVITRLIPIDEVGNEQDDSLSSRGINDPYTNIAMWQGKSNFGFKKAQWRVCVPAHPWNTAQMVVFNPANQEFDPKTGNIRLKRTDKMAEFEAAYPSEFLQEIEEGRAKEKAKQEQMEADRRKNIHVRPSEYRDIGKIYDVAGGKYEVVSPEDYNRKLDEWRNDRSKPIPLSTDSKDYKRLMGLTE